MAYVHVVNNLTSVSHTRTSSVERRKLSLATIARRRGLNPRAVPIICSRNGKWVKQTQWRRVTAKKDDVVTFIVMPRGQYGRIAAMLAVLVIATVVAGPIAGAGFEALGVAAAAGSNTLLVGTALVGAAITLGGSYLINVLFPAAGAPSASNPDAIGSPTYAPTLGAQNNQARLNGAIPVLYGRMRFIPDYASAPWSEWIDKVQQFHQVFVLTQGILDIETIQLGQTDIGAVGDTDYEIVEPGGTVTLFEPEVYSSSQVSGQMLFAPNDPDNGGVQVAQYDGDNGITMFAAGAITFKLDTATGVQHFYRANVDTGTPGPPGADWDDLGTTPPFDLPYLGPFPVCPPGRTTLTIGIDLSLPRGLFDTGTVDLQRASLQWRIDCQEIDDAGNAIGSWTTLDSEIADSNVPNELVIEQFGNSHYQGGAYVYENQRNNPVTMSFRISPPHEARWQVRILRVSEKKLSGQVGSDLVWTGLKSFLGSSSYGDCTVLAMRIASTSSANNASTHQVAVTGTRALSGFNGSTWVTPFFTRSIAWAIADMIRNETYGARLDDTAFDRTALKTLDDIWAARGDTFDFYAAQKTTLWDALTAAGRAGRTVPYHQAGVIRFHRDHAQTIPVQLFSSENIVKGSFTLKFSMPSQENDVDGIEVKYIDEGTWQQKSILLAKDGVVESVSPSTVVLDGVVREEQANNEAAYMLAADRYRRVFAEFDTEMEGLIASRGDLILIHHDTPRWGQSTRIVSIVGARTITLWGRLIDYDSGLTYFVQLRDARGRPSQPVQVLSYDGDLELIIVTDPRYYNNNLFDLTNSEAEPMHIVVGTIDTIPRLAVFLGATPRGGNRVSVQAVLEDARVHVN